MKKTFTLLLLALSSIFGYAQTIDPVLLQEMRQRTDDEKIKVIVIMKQQYDRQQLGRSAAHYTTRAERREFVVNELKQFAEASQYELRSTLSEMERQDMTTAPKIIYMANALYFSATRQAINDLAMRRDIELIGLDEKKHVLFDEEPRPANMARGITPNVTQVNADQVWAMGYTGQGVVVAVIDTGVNYNHLDLADHLWDGGSEYPNHGYDFYYDDNDPMDDHGHGTHCAGTVCGDGTAGQQTGMAPDATLMCVKVLDSGGYGEASVTCNAMQWAVEQGCDLFSMSLGWSDATLTERMLFRNTCAAILDAGVIGAIAAGNNGDDEGMYYYPIPYNVGTPGSCPPPYIDPVQENNPGGLSCAFCVGAVDADDNAAYFTSQGPVTWSDTEFGDYSYMEGSSTEFGLIRPDVCAPGVDIISADYSSNSGYISYSGTSMATPCVAGCISLLLSKDINTTPAEICQILEETAEPLEEGKSNVSGYGRVDVLAAINALNLGPLTFESVAVNDEQGNNDGNLNTGESVTLNLTLLNDSNVALDGATMVLSTQSTYVTITNGTAALPHFDAGQTQTIENIFGFTLSDDATANRAIHFTAEIFVDGEFIGFVRMNIEVYGYILRFDEVTVLNDDNGNGILDAGETANLHVIISNVGNEPATSIVGTLSTVFPYLTINETIETFEDIEINGQASADFNVTLSDSVPEIYIIDFSLDIVDDNERHTNLDFKLMKGIIVFADPYVKNICVSLWDTNYDGELSYDEAAAVYDLGLAFYYNTRITLFNELQYFTGLSSIDGYAFDHCTELKSIVLPNSITSIGDYAFNYCYGLTGSLIIPNSVISIGNNAFYFCDGLTALTIGNSVTSIGSEAFDCWLLNAVYYTGDIHQWCNIQFNPDSSNPLYYGHNLFIDSELVTDLVIPETVTEIKAYAFIGASCLTSLTFPNSVTSIDSCAFNGCVGLTGSLTIPNSVISIGNNAFYACVGLTALTIGNSVSSIGSEAFYGCVGLTALTIGNTVSSIGSEAFYYCYNLNAVYYTGDIHQWCNIQFNSGSSNPLYYGHNLFIDSELVTDLLIPETVTEIKAYAFIGATSLTSLTFPNSVTSIGEWAFSGCRGLTSLTIGNSVTLIGRYAFDGCRNLFSITSFVEDPPTVGDHVFDQISPNTIVYVPCGFEDVYASLSWGGFSNFYGMCGGTVMVVADPEEGGTVAGGGTFGAGQTFTVTATANEGYDFVKWTFDGMIVSNSAEYTFYVAGDMSLVAHFVPIVGNIIFADANVKAICVSHWDTDGDGELSYGEAASVRDLGTCFRENLDIASFDELQYFIGLSSVNSYAFDGCSGLSTIALPNSVTSIGSYAFDGCSGLSTIVLPNSVTSIGNFAFHYCSGLTSIEIPNSVTSIGSYTFSACYGLTGSLTIPNSVTSIGNSAFSFCSGLTSVEIPNSVTSIGNSAFSSCSGLTSIVIPNSVSSIGNSAFSFCSGLEQITVDSRNTVYDSRENCKAIINTNTNELVLGCKNTVIPNSVSSIGNSAFSSCSGLTSIVIPNSVTSIGNAAFSHCSGLVSLIIGNSVTTIGINAFNGCSSLASLIIGNSVTTIGSNAFYGCSGLASLIIGNSVTTIGIDAFYGCSNIHYIASLAETPPTINYHAFGSLSSNAIVINVPCGFEDAYASISWGGFSNFMEMCGGGGTVTVTAAPEEGGMVTGGGTFEAGQPCTVTATPIEGYTFFQWSLNGQMVSNSAEFTFMVVDDMALVAQFVPIGNIVFADSGVKNICVSHWDTNGDGELSYTEAASIRNLETYFKSNPYITSFNELQYFIGLTSIRDNTFRGCSGLTSIVIPNSVTSIGYSAFSYCSGLTSIVIPNSVTSIGNSAFYYCSGLTSVEIPNSVTSIGNSVFYYCSGLTSVEIPNSVTSIGNSAFSYCSGLTSVEIPNSVTSIGNYAFSHCSGLEQITVDSRNTVYDSRENCKAIINTNTNELVLGCKNTVIPNSVTSIGDYAFSYCSGLTSIEIPNSVTSIGNSAFSYCSGLASIEIPNSVTSIGDYAFYYCSGLTSIEIPNAVTSIGDYAFYYCSGLASLIIGNSVTSIGRYAFYGCSGLTSLTVLAEMPPFLGSNVFFNVNKSIPVYVPYGTIAVYVAAPGWNEFTNYQEMAYTTIPAYNESNNHYRFIASPLVDSIAPTTVDNMITETAYDLYQFSPSDTLGEWQNYKAHTDDFKLVNGQGYLYANENEVNIIFKGEFNEDVTKEVNLVYDANDERKCFNLVGNPFPCNAYIDREYYVLTTDGTDINPEPIPATTPIPPCTAVFVKAVAEGETVVFTRVAP